MKLAELFDIYQQKRLRGKSVRTVKLYKHTLASYGRTLGHEPTLDDLDDDRIIDHMHTVVDRGGAPETANKDRGQLLALWHFAIKYKHVDHWPSIPPLNEPERVPLGWLPGEIDRLFSTIDAIDYHVMIELRKRGQSAREVSSVPGNIFWSALLRILLDTGERIGAVRGLPRSGFNDSRILVPAHLRKGKRREMLYPLQASTVDAVRQLLSLHTSKLIFPYGYSETYLYRQYKKILETADLPTDRRSKFHRLRRTVASAVARAGGDPTAALDHASPRTTKKYLDPRIVGGFDVSTTMAGYMSDQQLRKSPEPANRAG